MAGNGSKPGERRGGRKKGTPNKRTQVLKDIADKALADGVSPLEVMLATMRELWGQATPPTAGGPLNMSKAMQAVVIAEKAAPYVHPKLAAVEAKHDAGDTLMAFLKQISGQTLAPPAMRREK